MLEDDQQVAAEAQVKSFITHLYLLIKSFYLCLLKFFMFLKDVTFRYRSSAAISFFKLVTSSFVSHLSSFLMF